ncbi:hypothetical protein ACU686_23380 [Yinghuangia aomiensis]
MYWIGATGGDPDYAVAVNRPRCSATRNAANCWTTRRHGISGAMYQIVFDDTFVILQRVT